MRFVFIMALLLLPVAATAESRPPAPPADQQARPDHPGWSVDESTGCWIWNPEPGTDDVMQWSGACDAEGKATGKGTLEWRYAGDHLDRYEGEYRAGKAQGTGTYTWANGKRYEGPWQHGEMHGKGKYFWPDGRHFEGEWKRGTIDGLGVAIFPDGMRYDGMWRNNAFNGSGTLTDASGGQYVGNFRDSAFHGYGTKTWSSGERYTGNWVNDRPDGAGEYWSDGQHYVGRWRDGCFMAEVDIFAIGRTLADCAAEFNVMTEPN